VAEAPLPSFAAERVRRALAAEDRLFAEVAADEDASAQALAVVLVAALAEGIGRWAGASGILLGVSVTCVGWAAGLLALHAAALALELPSRLGPLFRALGFAAAPFWLAALESLPLLGGVFWLAKWGLGLAAAVAAVRAVHDIDGARAALLVAIGAAGAVVVPAILF
jgi:hypothetical protein